MKDRTCIEFLQDILPLLSLRWSGYRKVHGQVCKRINRRIQELHLADITSYRSYLDKYPAEWGLLKEFCRITISRFYRDRQVFENLENQVLPLLAESALKDQKKQLLCWSAGCASGEEPYTLALLWAIRIKHHYPSLNIRILATDANSEVLERAGNACYSSNSIRELPDDLKKNGFIMSQGEYCFRPAFRDIITFEKKDLLEGLPEGPFHLILCRNLVFTYFEESLQREVLSGLEKILFPGGFLIIGVHEKLPSGVGFFEFGKCIFQKRN
jgi:chemotaxis protein methyltransferase CheR